MFTVIRYVGLDRLAGTTACLPDARAGKLPPRASYSGSVWSCQVFIKDLLCTFSNKAKASCYCVQHLQ